MYCSNCTILLTGLQHSGHLICFKCYSAQGPDTCNTIAMCSQDEVNKIQGHLINR